MNDLNEELRKLREKNRLLELELKQMKCSHINCSRNRIPYVGIGDTNYIDVTCKDCGKKWQETD